MYIGKVSKLTGATPKAIRYYESIGLLSPPKRLGNYRYYTKADVFLINIIKRAQKYGFKLSEIQTLIKSSNFDGVIHYDVIIETIDKKKEQIRIEADRLDHLQGNLAELKDFILTHNKCPYE